MNRALQTLDPTLAGPKASRLESELRRWIVGQEEAIKQIVNVYQVYQCGLHTPGRPVASLLLLGPTGTGKTRIVETTANALLGNERAFLKVDCGEFQHSHEIAKLIGSPPGYLGHRETAPLFSQENLNQHHTDTVKVGIVLFDEIEKGSDSLWNLLLGILDKGVVTLGDNRRVDFSHSMIFMTSNLGAAEMEQTLWPKLGFGVQRDPQPVTSLADADKLERTALDAARRRFTPEFINRIDKMIVFQPLMREQLHQILNLELQRLRERIFSAGPNSAFGLKVSQESRDFILKAGTDARYGARHLRRAMERLLVQPLANLMATGQIRGGDMVDVDINQEVTQLTFTRQAQDIPLSVIADLFNLKLPEPEKTLAAAAAAVAPKRKIAGSQKRSRRTSS